MSFMSTNPELLQGIPPIKAESLVAGTVTIWTPPDVNTRFVITDITVMIDGATSGLVTIYEDANTIANLIYRHTYDNTKGAVHHHRPHALPYVGKRGLPIKIDNPSGVAVRVILHGYKAY